MGRGTERPITCIPGCGYTFKHKRMDSRAWKTEKMLHICTGECAKRVQESKDREAASRTNSMVSMGDILKALEPVYADVAKCHQKIDALTKRVAKRLESRLSHAEYKERAAQPKPWPMNQCVKSLQEMDVHVIEKFREIVTQPFQPWSWEKGLAAWFNWVLDQCVSDPVLLMAGDVVRYHDSSGPQKVTKLQFFRCFAAKVTKWDPMDEADDAFFVGFWYPLVRACRLLCHWDNHIIFDLPATNRQKREFEMIWHDDMMDPREPNLQRDKRIAQVFYAVMARRKMARRQARMDDEKTQPGPE